MSADVVKPMTDRARPKARPPRRLVLRRELGCRRSSSTCPLRDTGPVERREPGGLQMTRYFPDSSCGSGAWARFTGRYTISLAVHTLSRTSLIALLGSIHWSLTGSGPIGPILIGRRPGPRQRQALAKAAPRPSIPVRSRPGSPPPRARGSAGSGPPNPKTGRAADLVSLGPTR